MRCNKIANIEVIWAGKRHYMCGGHAAGIKNLAEVMGWPFEPRMILNTTEVCQSVLGEEEIAQRKKEKA